MRKIVNGRVYDTRKATRVAKATALPYSDDFEYWEESLYKTASGEWFLAGWGGPYTHYGRPVGHNGCGGGYGLRPVTALRAREWLEEREVDPEVVLRHFTVPET